MKIEPKTQGEAWRSRSFFARIPSTQSAFSSAAIVASLSAIPENSLKNLDAPFQAELSSLATETDPEMFWEGLLVFADRLEKAEQAGPAMEIYSFLGQEEGVFPGVRGRARERLEALLGQGSFGNRFEVFTSRFLGEVADYRNLLPMVGCSVGFELAKTWSFGALVSARDLPWWTKGMGASVSSSIFGTMVEVPTYLALSHGLRALSGEKTEWIGNEFWRTALGFGALKLGSWGGSTLMENAVDLKGIGTASLEAVFTRGSVAAIPQATSLLSLWTAQNLEERWRLKDPNDSGAT